MTVAIATIEELAAAAGSTPADEMINAVVEVTEEGHCRSFEYP